MGVAHVDELSHHGILGQKWGVRRYQNKDGSLTSAGKAHRESESSGDSGESSSEKKSVGSKVASAASKTASAVSSAAGAVANTASKAKNKIDERSAKSAAKKEETKNTRDLISKKKDVTKMTDKELSQAVNRLQLEKQYSDLLNPKSDKQKSSGSNFVTQVLAEPATDILKQASHNLMGQMANKVASSVSSTYTNDDIVNPKKRYKDM